MMISPFPTIGVLAFFIFVLVAILGRIGRRPSPYRALARLHLLLTGIYVVGCFAWTASRPAEEAFPWADAFLGLYLYFALQYAFFIHVFATIIRGFSIEILVALRLRDGRASLRTIETSFHAGKGIDYLKDERIAVLIESGAIVERGGRLSLTPFGRFTAGLNRIVLRIWNLGYLGTEETGARR